MLADNGSVAIPTAESKGLVTACRETYATGVDQTLRASTAPSLQDRGNGTPLCEENNSSSGRHEPHAIHIDYCSCCGALAWVDWWTEDIYLCHDMCMESSKKSLPEAAAEGRS